MIKNIYIELNHFPVQHKLTQNTVNQLYFNKTEKEMTTTALRH